MMIVAFKRFDGQALGSNKFGECSGEREGKIGKTLVPPHTTPKKQFAPNPNQKYKQVRNQMIKAKSLRRNHNRHPSQNQPASIVSIVEGVVIRESFASGGVGAECGPDTNQ
jgi:hypothetical protein